MLTSLIIFFLMIQPTPKSTLFPYTTLFRSVCDNANQRCPIFPGPARRLHWSIDDPVDSGSESEPLADTPMRSEEHTSELQSRFDLVCRLLLEKKKKT